MMFGSDSVARDQLMLGDKEIVQRYVGDRLVWQGKFIETVLVQSYAAREDLIVVKYVSKMNKLRKIIKVIINGTEISYGPFKFKDNETHWDLPTELHITTDTTFSPSGKFYYGGTKVKIYY